jgi:general secretion pathway protein D
LKNVNAADLAKELGPLYQKTGGKSPRDMVEVTANDRSNSLIVLSSETNFKAIEKLVTGLDTDDAMEKVTRTFLLKNADAQDVAKQLQDLNKDQDNSSRYPYFIFSSSSSSAKGSKKLSVVADRRRNCIIVQTPPAQMEGIEKMIQELDEPVSDDSLAPRIYPLKYVSAVDIEDVLNELFLKKTQQRSYWDYYDNPEPQADRDVGRLYGKVRITSEPYANAIIVTSNSKENLAVVEDVLKQLDQPSEAGESTLRISLKFAKAFTVANNINILFAKNGSPPLRAINQQQPQGNQSPQQQQQRTASQPAFELERAAKEDGYFPWLGGQPDNTRTSDGRNVVRSVSDLVGRVRAVADERSNALLISANVHFFPQVLKLIAELDAPTDQVLIEARLVEVSSDFLDKLGVRWSPDGSQVFSAEDYQNSILAHTSARDVQGFGGVSSVNSPAPSISTAGVPIQQTLTSLRSGVLDSTVNMDFLIQFLHKTTDARILAEPQINIRDNETGRLFVGQQIPTLTASQNSGSIGLSQNFEYKDVGVILEVTPHINNTGDVELKIHAESSVVVPGVTILSGAVFDTRNFRTDLTAKNGQTLVLGGIIQKQVTDILYKTPLLGDIPGLKWLFNKKDKTSHEVELMVFLRPKVTRTPEDAKELMNEIYDKAPNVKKWKDDLHQKKDSDPAKDTPAKH